MKPFMFFALLIVNYTSAQKIVNVVMIDSTNQVTEKPEHARYFIAIKKYSDSSFERIEYNFQGPRIRSIFYKDQELKVKHGTSCNYNDSGYISLTGSYIDNQKSGNWYDSKKNEIQEFEDNALVATRPRVAKDTTGKSSEPRDEVESQYPGGINSYLRFLNKNFRYPDRALKLRKEGSVVFQFTVSTEGKPGDVSIARSVEFSLDEEVLRLASIMPDWIPAKQDGKAVKSYKKQPVTFKIP